jgi:hypothetical protein
VRGFRAVRVAILLLILLSVVVYVRNARIDATDWAEPLQVVIYPIDADGRDATRVFIEELNAGDFRVVDEFMRAEAGRYGVGIDDPVITYLAPEVWTMPPMPPADANPLRIALWSLKLRYWAWREATDAGVAPDIRIFVVYHDPDQTQTVPHSLGLQNGLIGIVNAFAAPTMAATNKVIITHEMLHTLGATDKYDPVTNYPLYPHGFAEPDLRPLVPQTWAEIMAGRVPISNVQALTPRALDDVLVGDATALEIRWLQAQD